MLSSLAAELLRIAKSPSLAFERILSGFAVKPTRTATPWCMLSSF